MTNWRKRNESDGFGLVDQCRALLHLLLSQHCENIGCKEERSQSGE